MKIRYSIVTAMLLLAVIDQNSFGKPSSDDTALDEVGLALTKFKTNDAEARFIAGQKLLQVSLTGFQKTKVYPRFGNEISMLLRSPNKAGKTQLLGFLIYLGASARPWLPDIEALAADKKAQVNVGPSVQEVAAAAREKIMNAR